MTCYVLGSVVLVAAAIANLTAALKERGEDLEERRLLEAFDADEIMAPTTGDGVSKAEFLLGISAMDAVDAAKLELYASHFDELDVAVEPPPLDEEAKAAEPERAARRRRRDRAAAAAADDDEATSLCPWWLRCDCTAADVVDDAGDVEDGARVEASVVGAPSPRDVEPDACRVC
ncbi:potassium channel [Aureococcus anophagefferens]|uniref:Potassium channel n=1 Tax=Aureococcus anophagefferens TaxID=44056 RepID=A0ABR1GB08_AURAN